MPCRSAASSRSSSGWATASPPPRSSLGRSRRFLARRPPSSRCVVLVDDIHWAEPALLELLAGLPALTGGADPRALPGPAGAARCPARLAGDGRLEPLGAGRDRGPARALDAPAATRVRIARAAAGNPLYRRGARGLGGRGRRPRRDPDQPQRPPRRAARPARRPARATRSSAARSRASSSTRAPSSSSPTSQSRPAVPGELGELARKDLIRMAAAGLVAGGVAYRFKHILVREAAYRATSKRLRARFTSASPGGSRPAPASGVGEYEAILGYHLEQAYRYRTRARPSRRRHPRPRRARGRLSRDRGPPRPGPKRQPRRGEPPRTRACYRPHRPARAGSDAARARRGSRRRRTVL